MATKATTIVILLLVNVARNTLSESNIPAWDATLSLHAPATIAKFNARCLDGSPGGYYFRPAANPSAATKWKFHFMGGGWCQSAENCLERSKSLLGSSTYWTPSLSALWGNNAGFYGLMAANNASNEYNPFGDWNFVWLAYCDGSSQTSNRDDPVMVNGTPLYMRGRALLDAHLYELESKYKFLSTATEVIISGTSAGGMSTYMHSSFIKSSLKVPNARLVAVPDAGWWWDHTAYGSSDHPWLDGILKAYTPDLWNATLRGCMSKCLSEAAQNGTALAAAMCYTQPNAYQYLDVPVFVVQSMVDTANLGLCYHAPCSFNGSLPGKCTQTEVSSMLQFATELGDSVVNAQAPFGNRDGHFLTSCSQHEESCRSFDWWGITIGGQTMNSTFTTWYNSKGMAEGTSVRDKQWPSDGSCTYQVSHGSC